MRGFCQWTRSSAQSVTVTPSGRVIGGFPTWIICLGFVGRCGFIGIPGRLLRLVRGHASETEWPALRPRARRAAGGALRTLARCEPTLAESYPQAYPEESASPGE